MVDEYPLFRKGITDVLASHPDFQVIGATADDKTALSLLSLKPDLLVLDLDAQGFSPTDLLSEVKYRLPSCRTLMLLNKAESSQVLMQAIRLDANGFILRTVSTDEFIDQLKLVHSGGMAASDKITIICAREYRRNQQKTLPLRSSLPIVSTKCSAALPLAWPTVKLHRFSKSRTAQSKST